MLFFPLLFLFLALELLFSPILLWAAVAPRWHRTLAVAYGAIAILAVGLWLRHFMRERIELSKNPAAAAHWRWSPRMPPEMFRRAVALFLSMRGWHVLSSSIVARGRVELIIQKDRYSIALLFVRPRRSAACAEDVQHLHAICDDARATFAALVSAAPCGPEALAAVRGRNLILLRYTDIAILDEVISLAAAR